LLNGWDVRAGVYRKW